jgi:hypothetical protein
MKIQAKLWLLAAISGLTLSAHAQTPDFIINTFDTTTEASEWARWWGAAGQVYEHDATVDADGNASSGSLKATINFDLAAFGDDNQFAVLRQFNPLNASVYTNLVFDLRWDPNSPTRPSGTDHGNLEYGFRSAGWGQTWLDGSRAIPTHGNWIRFQIPIRPTLANLDTVSGIVLKMWAGNAGNNLTGTATFWLDNVKLIAITDGTPPPPPTLSISRPEPGLNLIPTDPSYIWQRQNIRTVSTANSWFDEYEPVTYAITISKYPDRTHNNFQTHMFLVPANNLPYGPGDSAPDYNAPHAIFWQIANNSSGGAYTRFMIKTNQPSGDSQLWGAGTLALIGSSSPLGRWSLRISGASEASITTPDGTVTNFTIPAESVPFFADQSQGHPLYAWFGIQPNSAANIGQQAIVSRIEILREFTTIDDQFTEPALDSTRWAVAAHNAPGVAAVPPDALAWVKWTLPDLGFTLQQRGDLGPAGSWGPTTLTPAQIIDYKRVLLTPANPGFANGFFRLEKPAAP